MNTLKKWYALDQCGDMVYVGEFEDFEEADESLEYSVVWLAEEETARDWLCQLQELLGDEVDVPEELLP